MEKITGKNNDLVKSVKKLLTSSKKRREEHTFVLEGARLVFDALNSLYEVECFLLTESAYNKFEQSAKCMIERADKSYLISDDIADKLSDTKTSQGIFALCKMKNSEFEINCDDKLILLDNVQDPANLGTILRSAEALGINAVIIGGGCDLYNPKVLRGSMGSALRLNIRQCDCICDVINNIKNMGFKVYGTVPDRTATDITCVDFSVGSACVIGNEANGISSEVKSLCDDLITIKMLGNAESLNASTAASITMWEMLR